MIAAASPSTASSTNLTDDLAPRFFGGSPSDRGACQALVATRPPRRNGAPLPAGGAEPSEERLRVCLQLLSRILSSPQPEEGGDPSTEPIREQLLLQTWRAIDRMAPWVRRAAAHDRAPALLDELAELERRARAALRADGRLGGSYSAALTGGFAVAEPGGQADSVPGAATRATKTGFISLAAETRPLDLGLGWGAALGLSAGRRPVLTMVTSSQATEPVYRNATSVFTELRFAKASRMVELAAVSRAGANRIDLAPMTIRTAGTTQVYAPAANDIDEWALAFDARLEVRWYDREVWANQLAMETLDPLLRASVGIRHDERFHRTGDLQPFNDPTGRVFFGFALHPVRAAAVSAGGGFEFEGALRGAHRLPSGYRVFVESTMDLGRALRRRPTH